MNTEPSYYLEAVDFNPFEEPKIGLTIPLAKPQEEIWLSCIFGGDDANRCYNESVSLALKGHLDRTALHFALQDLILRHESLRSTFKDDGTKIFIYNNKYSNLVFKDLSDQKTVDQEAYIKTFLQQE